VTALKSHAPAVKMLRHQAPERFPNFANFDGFKSFIEWHEEQDKRLRPFRFVGRPLPRP
jgi:hypothetical protein